MPGKPHFVVLCALMLSACALKELPPREEIAASAAPNLIPPAQWVASGGGTGAVAENWLASWRDPSLDALLVEALTYNADLRLAACVSMWLRPI